MSFLPSGSVFMGKNQSSGFLTALSITKYEEIDVSPWAGQHSLNTSSAILFSKDYQIAEYSPDTQMTKLDGVLADTFIYDTIPRETMMDKYAISKDSSIMIGWCSANNYLTVFDLDNLKAIHRYLLTNTNGLSTNFKVSDDNLFIYQSADNRDTYKLDISTGNVVASRGGIPTTLSGMAYANGSIYLARKNGEVYHYPEDLSTGPTLVLGTDTGGGDTSTYNALSTADTGEFIAVNAPSARKVNVIRTSDNTLHPEDAKLPKGYAAWSGFNTLVIVSTDGITSLWKVEATTTSLVKDDIYINTSADYMYGVGNQGRYKVDVDFYNYSSATLHNIEITDHVTGKLVASAVVTDSDVIANNVTLYMANHRAVDITISNIIPNKHFVNRAYAVGDTISVEDTLYTYECITAGTTDSIKPDYPTSGDITDGTAVFTTKTLLTKPRTVTHVMPVMV